MELKSRNIPDCAGVYSFAVDGGAISTINLGVYIKAKSIIRGFFWKATTTATSGGAATIAFGVTGISTTCLLGATAVATFAAGTVQRGVDLDAAPITNDADGQITITIAVATLLTGVIQFVVVGQQLDF